MVIKICPGVRNPDISVCCLRYCEVNCNQSALLWCEGAKRSVLSALRLCLNDAEHVNWITRSWGWRLSKAWTLLECWICLHLFKIQIESCELSIISAFVWEQLLARFELLAIVVMRDEIDDPLQLSKQCCREWVKTLQGCIRTMSAQDDLLY